MFQKIRWGALLFSILLIAGCKTYYSPAGAPAPRLIQINDQLGSDTAIVNYLAPYKARLDKEMNVVIGETVTDLTRQYTAHETTMGNFFSDALLSIGQELDPAVQISFATKGGIRADVPKGPMTVSNMFEVMPFENYVVVLTITGSQFLKMLDHIVRAGGQPVAGMTLTLTNTTCEDVMVQGKPFDPSKNYTIVTYDYLADGGDGVEYFRNPVKFEKYNLLMRDGLINYVKAKTAKGEKINVHIDNRIKDARK
ncbi:5'-nucleotidase C-terminal domain-containing protein [Gynurincola endophyticus]|uniref:5'-nucleotidase C-terminal domain-containing protein n=1 Tax=Gynurincola endophyticus TaxID=2479004 RepID=UPI000F8EBED6|nr:5'-nucleotidase [Gynurincola endophyticus]